MRTPLAFAWLAAGTVNAAGQDVRVASTNEPVRVAFNLSWSEVFAGSTTPIPNPNGTLEPGESAQIALSIEIRESIGTPVVWPTGIGGNGAGTLRALASMIIDLVGDPASMGSWSHLAVHEFWAVGLTNGTPTTSGTRVDEIYAGQFPGSIQNLMTTNPIESIWSGVWTPSLYSPVTAQWTGQVSTMSPSGFAAWVYARESNSMIHVVGSAAHEFHPLNIPVIPAPASALILAPLLWTRRARR